MSKLIKLAAVVALPSLLLATSAFAAQDLCQSFLQTGDSAAILLQVTSLATAGASIQSVTGVPDPATQANIQACLADYSQLAYKTQLAPYVAPTSFYGSTAMAVPVSPTTPLTQPVGNFIANNSSASLPPAPPAPSAPSGLQSSAGGLHQASYLQSDSGNSKPKKAKTSFSWLN